MQLFKEFTLLVRTFCVFGIVLGLAVQLGYASVPDALLPLWQHIPLLGVGLMGRIGTLFVTGLLTYALDAYSDSLQPTGYLYYR